MEITENMQPLSCCRPLASSWEKRKAAQRAALEAKARHKAELFRAAMEVRWQQHAGMRMPTVHLLSTS